MGDKLLTITSEHLAYVAVMCNVFLAGVQSLAELTESTRDRRGHEGGASTIERKPRVFLPFPVFASLIIPLSADEAPPARSAQHHTSSSGVGIN